MMIKKAYVNYPIYFNRLWVPSFDEDGNLIVPAGLEKFVDTEKQFERREKEKVEDEDDKKEVDEIEVDDKEIESSTYEFKNDFHTSSIIRYVSERIKG